MAPDATRTDPPTGTTFDALCGDLDYPMFVVTAAAGRRRSGCLVGFVTQVSLDPQRMLVCLSTANVTCDVAADADWLGVHLLRETDHELARWFGAVTADDGVDKFASVPWTPGPAGVPLLDGVDCIAGRIVERIPQLGDHVGHLIALDGPTMFVDPGRAEVPQLGYQAVADLSAGHPPGETEQPAQEAGVARDATSLTALLEGMRVGGFTGDLASGADGRILCRTCGHASDARDYPVHELRRLEGASDPDEMLAVVASTCPACGAQATLVLTFGPMATDEDMAVLERLPAG